MPVYSQNGYEANNPELCATYTVPGSKVRLRLRRGQVATVLLWIAEQFDDRVEDIDKAQSFIEDAEPSIAGGEPSTLLDDWSYAERPVRGSTSTLSNHASGTAIDLNATQHPRGVSNTFTDAQIREVRAILRRLVDPLTARCVVRWGEDYRSAPVDGMHFEIDADPKAVARVAASLAEKEEEEDDMQLTDKVELSEAAARNLNAAGNDFKAGDEVSVAYLLLWGDIRSQQTRKEIDELKAEVAALRGTPGT